MFLPRVVPTRTKTTLGCMFKPAGGRFARRARCRSADEGARRRGASGTTSTRAACGGVSNGGMDPSEAEVETDAVVDEEVDVDESDNGWARS